MREKKRRILLFGLGLLSVVLCAFFFVFNEGVENRFDDLEYFTMDEIKPIEKEDKVIIGIAFGGGSVRGFSHIGVIKALEEAGIKADIVTGTSVGSIIAAVYASGLSGKEIEKLSENINEFDIADLKFSKRGLIQGKKLSEFVNKVVKNKKLEEPDNPIGITAVDLTKQKEVLITRGNTGGAVQASSSIPGSFIPVVTKNSTLVDGGMLSLVPIKFLKKMGADVIIAVDVYCGVKSELENNALSAMYKTFRFNMCENLKSQLKDADFIIRPNFTLKSNLSFSSKDQAIKAGYEATKKLLPKIKKSPQLVPPTSFT